MAQTFRRRETKYELDGAEYRRLRRVVAENLPPYAFRPDRYVTFVSTIYFDTRNLDFFNRAKDFYDDSLKLRLKDYYYEPEGAGRPEVLNHCFVEIKERRSGEVLKRRIRIPKQLVPPLFALEDIWAELIEDSPGIEFDDTSLAIYREIRKFLTSFEVTATSVVNYRREVFQKPDEEQELRITFDDRIRIFEPESFGLDGQTSFFESGDDSMTVEKLGVPDKTISKSIMEIKCRNGYPLWLEGALQSYAPQNISKFTTSVDFLRSRAVRREPAAAPTNGKRPPHRR